MINCHSWICGMVKYMKSHPWAIVLFIHHCRYVSIIVNDVCSMIGTAVKISLEVKVKRQLLPVMIICFLFFFQVFDSAKFTAAGILLGIGTFLVWIGVLRYLGFFSHYNVVNHWKIFIWLRLLSIRRSIRYWFLLSKNHSPTWCASCYALDFSILPFCSVDG